MEEELRRKTHQIWLKFRGLERKNNRVNKDLLVSEYVEDQLIEMN